MDNFLAQLKEDHHQYGTPQKFRSGDQQFVFFSVRLFYICTSQSYTRVFIPDLLKKEKEITVFEKEPANVLQIR